MRLPVPPFEQETKLGEEGFEPSKAMLTDLQSAPFDRSGTLPTAAPVYHIKKRLSSNKKNFFA